MLVDYDLLRSLALFAAGLLGAGLGLHVLLRWRYAMALTRARRAAERLRQPAGTLAAIEDRGQALDELVAFPDQRAAADAVRPLLAAREATVRSAAIEVLRETRTLERWRRDLHRGPFRAKLGAIEALGEVGDERALDELLEALGDDDPDVARAAAHAICARDADYGCERLTEALASPKRRLAETAAAALVRQGEEVVDLLVGQLSNTSAQARHLAVDALAAIGDESLKDVLLPRLAAEPDPEVRAATAGALARLDGDVAAKEIQRLARSDPDWFVRARCHSLLAEMNADGAQEFLLESLKLIGPELGPEGDGEASLDTVFEGSRRVRSAIVTGLRLLGMPEEEVLAAARAAEPSAEQEVPGIEAALALLRDVDAARRVEAARLLGEAGPGLASALLPALSDPEPAVRSEAAKSLGRIGSGDSLPALSAHLNDPDAGVRLAVTTALRAVVTREAARELTE